MVLYNILLYGIIVIKTTFLYMGFPFHTVHGVLKARILKCFANPFSSEPHSVRPLRHNLTILGGASRRGLVSLS